MPEHLPKTLKVVENEDYGEKCYALQDQDSTYVLSIEYGHINDDRAIAHRIKALWNALDGVTTEDLENIARLESPEARLWALARVPGATLRQGQHGDGAVAPGRHP